MATRQFRTLISLRMFRRVLKHAGIHSSLLIASEKETRPVSQLLASLESEYAETNFLLSSLTVMELEHGWHRANTPETAIKRRRYLDEVFAIIPVEPFTSEMAVLAAKIDAEMKKVGRSIATADLLIGVTTLHYGYSIGTAMSVTSR